MGLKQEVGCVCQAQPQKNPKPDNITTSTSNELRSKGAAPIHAWDTRWITCAYESPNLPSLMHDTCHTLKVRYNTYPGATTTHTATPLWGKNQTTWSLPSTDNSNTAEQLSLSRLILEAVRDLADGLLAPAYPRGPQGLQTSRPPELTNLLWLLFYRPWHDKTSLCGWRKRVRKSKIFYCFQDY